MAYFTEDFNQFFKDLAANNHKEWFDENRKRYEKSVKKPFEAFVADALHEIGKHDPTVQIPAKDAIFRINKDVRFSKDKSPYKLDRSAILSAAGRKDHSVPGFYISLGPESVSMGGGAYFLPPDALQRVREALMRSPKKIKNLLEDKAFQKHFPEGIQGEENKRLPKKFAAAAETLPLLFKKQYYYMHAQAPELTTSPKLMDVLLDHYHAAFGLQEFLREAVAQ
jgi:uncharacterized protein (TIGR02453 family)